MDCVTDNTFRFLKNTFSRICTAVWLGLGKRVSGYGQLTMVKVRWGTKTIRLDEGTQTQLRIIHSCLISGGRSVTRRGFSVPGATDDAAVCGQKRVQTNE